MRIAVDARPLEQERTGVGRYLEGLLGAWLDLVPTDEFVLLSPRPVDVPVLLENRVDVRAGLSRLPGTVWLQAAAAGEARSEGCDLFFGSLGIVPIRSPLPSVATVHDLTPLLFPEWHSLKNRLGFAPFIGPTVRAARRIACVSASTLRDLVARFPEAEGKSVVVPNGFVPPATSPGGGDESGAPGVSDPYVLFLGTREPRKNLLRLVEAMGSIWDRRPEFPHLVVAGGSGWGLEELGRSLAASRHGEKIRLLGWVSAERTTGLLRGARLLAYPSLYEGFGLPPLEAMALGTPVVASSSSSLPEVVGDAGLLPDPRDTGAIAAAIEKANDDEAFRHEAVRRGRERARRFTWEAAAKTMRVLCQESLA